MDNDIRATQLLRNDHKRLRALFQQFETAGLRAHEMKAGISREIFMEIEIHSKLEEEFFYPAFQNGSDENGRALIEGAIDAHHGCQEIMGELRTIHVDHEQFTARFQDLMETVMAHVEEEEKIIFPRAEEILASELMELGTKMAQRREELLKEPGYQNSIPSHVQNPNGGEQMRTDRVA